MGSVRYAQSHLQSIGFPSVVVVVFTAHIVPLTREDSEGSDTSVEAGGELGSS